MALQYFSGQGKVYVMTRDTSGNPLAGRWVGNVPMFKFSLTEDVEEHKESYSGNRLTDLRLTKELKAEVEFEAEQIDASNLNLQLFGTTVTQTSGSVTGGETLGASGDTLAIGNVFILDKKNVTTTTGLAIVDSASGTPNALTSSNYDIDGDSGMITITNVTTGGPFTMPLSATYDYGAATTTKLFGTSAVEYWIRFVGVNTAVSGSPSVTIDLYRCRLSPSEEFNVINDEVAKFTIKGSVLADDTKTQAGDLGQFGSIYLAA